MAIKELAVFAGPNGSGKSTLQEKYKKRIPSTNINADVLTKKLGSEIAGARETIRLQDAALKQGISFTVETTLSGNSPIKLMKKAKARGYKINLYYSCTTSADVNKLRVSSRVSQGGHDVPSEAVERRYHRSLENLEKATKIAQTSHLFDNSGERSKHILSVTRNRIKVNKKNISLASWLPKHFADKALSIIKDRGRGR